MYSRKIGDEIYTFEPSGGLLNASLVMRDEETDSWWSIISDEAIHGSAEGQRLRQLPGSEKTTWGDWRGRHPDARVLSVDGVEHRAESPYDKYFASDEGFRRLAARDDRLPTKAEIYAFRLYGEPWAVPHELFADGGAVTEVGEERIFLYRRADDSHYRSTTAFHLRAAHRLERDGDDWVLHTDNGREFPFDAESRSFGLGLEPVAGFDTYWYIWSLTHEDTGLVTAPAP